ncbi:MAG: co-chaperone GroES [Smithellaceae bacterium]|nr:co-chaperone GroES [Smithellaceae bacterium]
MKIKPLHDHVIVSRLESEEKTPGGIIIPDTAKEKPQEGKVLAVGPGRLDKEGNRITPEVKEGDKVLFTKWGGTEVKIDGRELMIMKEDDILAVLE